MSEVTSSEPTVLPQDSVVPRPPTELPSNFSVGRRFDPPHVSSFLRDQTSTANPSNIERPWPPVPASLPSPDAPRAVAEPNPEAPLATDRVQPPVSTEKLLLLASQHAEQLVTRMAEIERRDQRLNSQLAQLDYERRELRGWVQRVEEELRQREEALLEREAACAKRLDELAAIERACRETNESTRREHEQIEATRHRLETELQQERTLLENRLRFQQEHLAKTRREVEQAQAALAQDRQAAHAERHADLEQLRLRQKQLDRYRDSLDAREESVQRERELIEQVRADLQEQLRLDRDKLLADQLDSRRETERLRSEIQRQQAMLAQHAENLEARHRRIDKLRTDVEETHRQTLEMRLAVEETFGRLTLVTGDESARREVEQTRQAVLAHFQHARESLDDERGNLTQWQARLEQQHAEIHTERQALRDWLVEQESDLRQQAEATQAERQEYQVREQAWHALRDRWLREKIEAEEVIRELLRRIGTPA